MWKTILQKIIIAIFATLGLCLLLSMIGYTPKGEQEPNTSYMTFMGMFLLFLIFIAPMLLSVGILFSIVVDRKVNGIFKTIFSYLIGGGVFGFLFYLIVIGNQANSTIVSEGIALFVGLGAFSSLFFYGIQFALETLFKKLNFN